MRDATKAKGMDRAERLPDDKSGVQFFHPGCYLVCCNFRIERIGPDNDLHIVHLLFQETGNPAVSPAAHSMDIENVGRNYRHIDCKFTINC